MKNIRWSRPVLLLLTGLLLSGCGSRDLAPLPADAVVLAFGDSLTFGTGAERDESYPAVLAGLIARRVINGGVPGEFTAAGRDRLPALLDRHQPSLLLLCHGGNDLLRHIDQEETVSNLRAMIAAARVRDVQVVLIGVPEPGLFAPPPVLYRELADEFAIPYQEDILRDILYDNELKSDMIHPNADGYKAMAEAVAALLAERGAL